LEIINIVMVPIEDTYLEGYIQLGSSMIKPGTGHVFIILFCNLYHGNSVTNQNEMPDRNYLSFISYLLKRKR